MHAHLTADQFDLKSTIYIDPSIAEGFNGVPANAVVAFSPSELYALQENTKNIGIYFWQPSDQLKKAIEKTPTQRAPTHSIEFSADEIGLLPASVDDYLTKLIATELLPAITSLQHICGATRLRFSTGTTKTQMCPLFHVDRLRMRMIVTLRGPGTEWVADADIKRKGLGKRDNRKVVRESAIIHQINRFQVAFLKGEDFSNVKSRSIVHRSPSVGSNCAGRWFVKVDVLDSCPL